SSSYKRRAVPAHTTTAELLDRYDGVLLDIYGVLFDASGPLPGALELLADLRRRRAPHAFVTSDASRSTATYGKRFASHGIDVAPEQVVTAGSLLPGCCAARGLVGARTCVLGTPESADYVRAGGGGVVPVSQGMELDVLAVCDDAGFEFRAGIEWA